jgi:hypothetical protein
LSMAHTSILTSPLRLSASRSNATTSSPSTPAQLKPWQGWEDSIEGEEKRNHLGPPDESGLGQSLLPEVKTSSIIFLSFFHLYNSPAGE